MKVSPYLGEKNPDSATLAAEMPAEIAKCAAAAKLAKPVEQA